jgi:hypothetical protein
MIRPAKGVETMKRVLALIGMVIVAAAIPLMVHGYGKSPPGAVAPAVVPVPKGAAAPLVEAGKRYHFYFFTAGKEGGEIVYKVLEEPQNNWVKVRFRENDRTITGSINLNNVAMILVDPEDE